MKVLSIFIFCVPLIQIDASTEKLTTTSTRPTQECALDNSCNSTSKTVEVTSEGSVDEKWKYNTLDTLARNETVTIRMNDTNSTNLNFDLDVTKIPYNKSSTTNTTETKVIEMKYHIEEQANCFCNVNVGSCDLNCCCDPDCIFVNRNVFESCNKTKEIPTDEVCLSKILDSPLLCVVKDNLYSKHFYPAHKKTGETDTVEKLLRNREIFGWTVPGPPVQQSSEIAEYQKELKEYHIGSSVFVFDYESGLEKFRFPQSTIHSRDCANTQPINFLENYDTVCTHRVSKLLAHECEDELSIFNPQKYYQNFSLISNPATLNLSLILTCGNSCRNITPFICNFDTDDIVSCEQKNFSVPIFTKANICQRAVSSVHYNFLHNGTEGIVAAGVYIYLEDVPLKPNLLWAVKFKLTNNWYNQTDSYELSGYPGYVFGKAIITGVKVSEPVSENKTRSVMKMSHRRNHWLTSFSIDPRSGVCIKDKRNNLLFQQNIYSRCRIKMGRIHDVGECEKLQNEIYQILLGPKVNISNTFLSAYGLPNVYDPNNWVPITTQLSFNAVNESCAGLITAAKLVILHAAVGDHENPQNTIVAAKITGISMEQNIQQYDELFVGLAVNFYDVTKAPLRIFAEPPTYEVKLPTDFFYPFFSSSANNSNNKISIFTALSIFLLALVHIFYVKSF